jgi:hypothetical protein
MPKVVRWSMSAIGAVVVLGANHRIAVIAYGILIVAALLRFRILRQRCAWTRGLKKNILTPTPTTRMAAIAPIP